MSSINTHTLGNIEVELPDNEGDDYVARCYELDISAQHPDEYIAISLLCLKLAEYYKSKSSNKSVLTSEKIKMVGQTENVKFVKDAVILVLIAVVREMNIFRH